MTSDLDDAREHIFRASRLVHLLLVFLPQHLEPMNAAAAGGLSDVFMDVLHHLEAADVALLRHPAPDERVVQ